MKQRIAHQPVGSPLAVAQKSWRSPARRSLIALVLLAIVAATWSFVLLQNPAQQPLDQRVHDVASQLKCPICQGESVADSPSQLAQQMRGVIRQQLQAGKSEQEVIQYFQNSYGEQIVWSPPWQGFTLFAWLVPIGLLLAGTVLLFFILRNWRSSPVANSTTDDAELADIDEEDLALYRAQLEQELAIDTDISAQTEREQAARTALHEIELDYRLGNIEEPDYRTLREKYVRRALVALKSRSQREQELDDTIEEQLRKLREQHDNANHE